MLDREGANGPVDIALVGDKRLVRRKIKRLSGHGGHRLQRVDHGGGAGPRPGGFRGESETLIRVD